MKQFTENQRKIIRAGGIFTIIAAAVALGISLGRGSSFALIILLPLVFAGVVLIILANKK